MTTKLVQTEPIASLSVPSGQQSCMESWNTASRHITGTHMELESSLNYNSVPTCDRSELRRFHTQRINFTYFVSRWEVLQSLLRVPKFICIHLSWQSKTWSVNHSVTPLQGGQKPVLHIWQAWDALPEDKTHAELPVKSDINSFWQAGLTESFPVRLSVDIPLCFIHLCRSRVRDAQPERKLGSFGGGYGVRSAGLIPFLFK